MIDIYDLYQKECSIERTLICSSTETSSISISFKSGGILCDLYSMLSVTIIHMDTFHGSEGKFCVPYSKTSFEKRNHHFALYLTFAYSLTDISST